MSPSPGATNPHTTGARWRWDAGWVGLVMSVLVCVGGPAAAASGAPAPISLTTTEAASLAQRQVVIRTIDAGTIGVLDVTAPPDVVMEEVMNLPARVAEVGFIEGITIIDDQRAEGSGVLVARWEVGAMGLSRIFHVKYEVDATAGWCAFAIDHRYENDIQSSRGSYQVYAHGGGSRLVYRAAAEDSNIPAFLRERVQSSAVTDQLRGIQARAESR